MNETTTQTLQHRFISRLEQYFTKDDRAVLAQLRRGLGRDPGTAMEMFPIVAPYTASLPRHEENAYFLVASLFGLYPSQSWKGDTPERNNLGRSLSFLKDNSESTEKRFVALLNANADDLPNHLRHAVSLLKANDKPINWLQLLKDLKNWSHEDRFVQRNWAKGFWGTAPEESTTQTEEVEKGEISQ